MTEQTPDAQEPSDMLPGRPSFKPVLDFLLGVKEATGGYASYRITLPDGDVLVIALEEKPLEDGNLPR